MGIHLGSALMPEVLHGLDPCYPGVSLLSSYSHMGSRKSAFPKEAYPSIGLLKG